jgi:Fe-S-cluster formation regulator IscX/YfhJ
MKIHPVGAELFHAGERMGGQTDRQTDMTKLIVAFRNFSNTPNVCSIFSQ